jgi:hypothetical protein
MAIAPHYAGLSHDPMFKKHGGIFGQRSKPVK